MGANTSREDDASYNSAYYRPTSSATGNQQGGYSQPSYSPSQYEQNYPVQEAYPAYPQAAPAPAHTPAPAPPAPVHGGPSYVPPAAATSYGGPTHRPQSKFDRRYSTIADSYNSLEQVSEALARAGLESSNLILGIDFTKSNEWTGDRKSVV